MSPTENDGVTSVPLKKAAQYTLVDPASACNTIGNAGLSANVKILPLP